MLERNGKIVSLRLHPKYPLRAHGGEPVKIRSTGFPNGRQVFAIFDFEYIEMTPKGPVRVIEDVKGQDNDKSRLKRAFFEAQYGIQVRVTR